MWPAPQQFWGAQAYQNYASENVDWASLAQQWIQMKEASEVGTAGPPPMQPPLPAGPPPPPPGVIEAPLPPNEQTVMGPMIPLNPPLPVGVPPAVMRMSAPMPTQPWMNSTAPMPPMTQPTPQWPEKVKKTLLPSPVAPMINNFQVPANPTMPVVYGTGIPEICAGPPRRDGFIGHPRMPVKPMGDFSSGMGTVPMMPDGDFTMDAARRRSLPAWIREGLEKMEREKSKREEREELLKRRDELFKMRHQDERTQELIDNPARSKFDSDSEDETEDNEDNGVEDSGSSEEESRPSFTTLAAVIAPSSVKAMRKKKSRFTSKSPSPAETRTSTSYPGFVKAKTEFRSGTKSVKLDLSELTDEERLQLQMYVVKSLVTEILLDVTGAMMYEIASEAFDSSQEAERGELQGSHNDELKPPVTNLGLAAYESGTDESDDDENHASADETKLRGLLGYESSGDDGVDPEVEVREKETSANEVASPVVPEVKSETSEEGDSGSSSPTVIKWTNNKDEKRVKQSHTRVERRSPSPRSSSRRGSSKSRKRRRSRNSTSSQTSDSKSPSPPRKRRSSDSRQRNSTRHRRRSRSPERSSRHRRSHHSSSRSRRKDSSRSRHRRKHH